MHTLKGVTKRWSVKLLHDVLANLHDVVGPDAEDVGVERTVVNCAHGDAIGDYWLASVAVLLDMSRIEKFGVSQPAQGARAAVGPQDPDAERGLMQSPFDCRLRVLSTKRQIRWVKDSISPLLAHLILERDDELVFGRFLADEPNGIHVRSS